MAPTSGPGTFRPIVALQHHGSNWLDRTSHTLWFDAIDPMRLLRGNPALQRALT